ncbi:MAG: 23S rRNA (adenine(2503)-C(2))-methyltransferase RlmN, partial [Actinobacteria bacterium]|nr:23S rRNA (adenine(2503)-C(2))-methyltransferase RlmN [Actinomycetota bacterium]NIS36054.1 23S rRNA (adenine(2503)-C(2))-methyltransferase RlmN [Actinomycetota bacterium]NIU22116.1 23S rRNA (adenine(2503)-C(2))-methyltransferase RlmN [Actinomycetota bacterium]NIU70629.1 23S rRNA (adenine(2503)-C(2))-methyltransferase RlmN [Actinomycetota bacterium]NIV90236.1 23S rRNA (adenine(2503)-C(2))-methyltransferase RlmN [Actinomycetota bacterium]
PLANYPRVREAIRRMIEVMGLSARSVTVSTVGVIPGIDRLAAEPWPLTLALSLHAADDHLREQLVPLNARYPIDDLIDAVHRFTEGKGRRVTLEWTLMRGINDTAEQ